MNIILNCDELQKNMIKLIKDTISNKKTNKYIYITAFQFDINYNIKLKKYIKKALDNKIDIFILTSSINPYIIDMKHENLHIKNKINIGKKYDDIINLLKKQINFTENEYVFLNHARYMYNGEYLILGGTNSSLRYSGNYSKIISTENNFSWYEHGLIIKIPNKQKFFNDIYDNITNSKIRDLSLKINDNNIILSNKKQYEYIIENINNAKENIYIENQYFFSCNKYTINKINKTLANRVINAIKKNENFHLEIICNYYFYDELDFVSYIMNSFIRYSFNEFRLSIPYNDTIFNKYVSLYLPIDNKKIVVHSKVFCFDKSKMLYTTCNIADRSFNNYGDVEIGIIINDVVECEKLYNKLKKIFPKKLFYKYNDYYNSIDSKMLIKSIDYLAHLFNLDIHKNIGL